uniref:Melan-A n=1 Tax=Neovison vison TaxID=452646 RepID=A0A8C7EQW1_NEOVI
MSREEVHLILGYPKKGHNHSYITAEEAAGIGILTMILGILLLIGCCYWRRRSGYRSLRLIHNGKNSLCKRCWEKSVHCCQGHTLPFSFSQVPDAPPAYEKLSIEKSTPPYSP